VTLDTAGQNDRGYNKIHDLRTAVGVLEPPEQAETLDHQALLREVQQVQERPVGLRRPGHRRLPAETGLD
jgi:hypothetical protein